MKCKNIYKETKKGTFKTKILVYHYTKVIKLLKITTKALQNLYFQFHTFGDDMIEEQKHGLRQKEFLTHSGFILKRLQELQD